MAPWSTLGMLGSTSQHRRTLLVLKPRVPTDRRLWLQGPWGVAVKPELGGWSQLLASSAQTLHHTLSKSPCPDSKFKKTVYEFRQVIVPRNGPIHSDEHVDLAGVQSGPDLMSVSLRPSLG